MPLFSWVIYRFFACLCVFLQTHREILELTRALMNTMYMRARVERKGERGQIYKEGEVEREIGKVEVTCFC